MSDHGKYAGVVDVARNGIDEIIRLKVQMKSDEALLRQVLEALEYASDMLGPVADPCDCSICLAEIALRKRLEDER